MPATQPPNTSFIEGISCTNGVSLTIPVTSTPSNDRLLWQDPTTGQLEGWVLDGASVGPTPTFLSQECGDTSPDYCSQYWTVVDTQANTVLWWNKESGHLRTWELDSNGNVTIDSDLMNPSNTGYMTCGTRDGCINGSYDWRPIGRVVFTLPPPSNCSPPSCYPQYQTGLLWHDPISGNVEVWLIGGPSSGSIDASAIGTTVTSTYTLTNTCSAAAGCSTQWTAKTTADFDGDGNTDLAWLNENGTVEVWLLSAPPATSAKGFQTLSATCGGTCAQDWRLVGAADVNGDGFADLLWHNYQGTYPGATPGTLRNWLLDGHGNVSSTQDLSEQCPQANGCATNWTALGYAHQ